MHKKIISLILLVALSEEAHSRQMKQRFSFRATKPVFTTLLQFQLKAESPLRLLNLKMMQSLLSPFFRMTIESSTAVTKAGMRSITSIFSMRTAQPKT